MTIYKQLASKPKDAQTSDDFEEYCSDEEDRVQLKRKAEHQQKSNQPWL